jgi:hypothetical protein
MFACQCSLSQTRLWLRLANADERQSQIKVIRLSADKHCPSISTNRFASRVSCTLSVTASFVVLRHAMGLEKIRL